MAFTKLTIRDVPLTGKTVLLRADYNVPLVEQGGRMVIHDDYRVVMSLPTLRYLLEHDCRVVICAHLGRPDGKVDAKLSLEPVAQRLADDLHRPVHFVPACIGDKVKQVVKAMPPASLVLLENLRFHPEEEANDETFARQLATDSGADYFVQDGFGVVHRAHASTEAVTHFLPSVAGLLLEREVSVLTKVADAPERPFSVVLGGAKISDKVQVVEDFIKKADKVVIGGAMANDFLAWQHHPIGRSRFDQAAESVVGRIMQHLDRDGTMGKLLLPLDVAVAADDGPDAARVVKQLDDVAETDRILDIGDATIIAMEQFLEGSKTVLWNGTLGYAESAQFATGSAALASWLAARKGQLESVIGGGDTADYALRWDGKHGASFSHVSTGGGASLELLSGEKLPGVEALLPRGAK